jgi:rSAM/selenodomain-associated transferase 2
MISVIIPTLNEQENISGCIESIKADGGDHEIIVCDGGSSDATVQIVREYDDVILIETGKGRGSQMNKGGEAANGEVLLFLHADTKLERGWSRELLSALVDESIIGGAFAFRIDNYAMRYRLIESWVKLRCTLFSLPYGDQGIFVRRGIFDRTGGYRDIPLMEDVEIIGRLKKEGKLALLKKCAVTRDRRWVRKGWIRASVSNQMVMLMYKMGIDPHTLARLYYRR